MRSLALCAVGAFLCLASIQSALGETINLFVNSGSHSGFVQARALNTTRFASLGSSAPIVSITDTQGTSTGQWGTYNVTATSSTVTGTPGTTVTGVNLTSSMSSHLGADRGGNANSQCFPLMGTATATVQQATSTGGRYYAEGTISFTTSSDAFTAVGATCVVELNGTAMATINTGGTSFTTEVVDVSGMPTNRTVSVTPTSGALVPVQFLCSSFNTITVRHVVNWNGAVNSTGSSLTSQAAASTLEDIHVEYR